MNRKIKRNLPLIFALSLTLWGGTLLAQTEEQIEKFCQARQDFFNEHLDLTEAEAKAFLPLYEDFYNRKMKIQEDERNTFRYTHKNEDNLSEKDITENLEKIFRLKTEIFELEQKYYQTKFVEVLPSRKVMKLYKVEWDYRKHLIRKIREGKEGHGKHDGKSEGRGESGQMPMGPPPTF
jgi:hypothetical protein